MDTRELGVGQVAGPDALAAHRQRVIADQVLRAKLDQDHRRQDNGPHHEPDDPGDEDGVPLLAAVAKNTTSTSIKPVCTSTITRDLRVRRNQTSATSRV